MYDKFVFIADIEKERMNFHEIEFYLTFFSSVIDIPDRRFLQHLQNNKELKHILEETKSTGIELIIHFTPEKIFQSKDYQRFIDSIDAKRHLIANDSNK